jgi:hypothetical protein
VEELLNSKLELVSLGISAEVIKVALKAAAVPGAEQMISLSGVNCNPARNGARENKTAQGS